MPLNQQLQPVTADIIRECMKAHVALDQKVATMLMHEQDPEEGLLTRVMATQSCASCGKCSAMAQACRQCKAIALAEGWVGWVNFVLLVLKV